MKIMMDIHIFCNDPNKGLLGTFRKELQSDILPTVGAKIEDPVWKDPREIKHLVINYNRNFCYIDFGSEDLAEEDYGVYKKAYQSHGWTAL